MTSTGKESFAVVGEDLPEPCLLDESIEEEKKSTDGRPALTNTSGKCVSLNTGTTANLELVDEHSGLKRKSDAFQTAENENDTNDGYETKKRCGILDARIQSIQIQVANANGEKLEFEEVQCVRVNLVNEELLKAAKADTLKMKTINTKLTQELKTLKNMLALQLEEIKGLKVECEVYKKDLELERTAKQKMVSQFEVDLQSLIKRSHTLIVGTADETPETVEKTSAQSFTPSLNVKTNVNHGLEGRMNAVARLFRIQNVKKKTEPIYTVLDDRRSPKGGRQFLIEVECNGETSRGTGLNKRSAKRMAAENILIKMGYAKDELAESEGSKKSSNEKSKRKIVFKEPEIIVKTVSAVSAGGSAGRQIAPGVLLMKSQDNLAFQASVTNDGANGSLRIPEISAIDVCGAVNMIDAPDANDAFNEDASGSLYATNQCLPSAKENAEIEI